MSIAATEIRFRVDVGAVPRAHLAEARRKAEEAFVLALLRHGDISAGRAAELLGVDRWKLGGLMALHGASQFDVTRAREDREREVAGAGRAAGRGSGAPEAITEEAEANAASIALLQSWLEDEATDDPEEIRQAEQELDQFKRAINAERERAGARQIYP